MCVLKKGQKLDDKTMQNIAMELNQAETAFVYPNGTNTAELRWFTPTVEVDLCGHATLAAGHVLFNECSKESDIAIAMDAPLTFSTKSGMLSVARKESRLEMLFPARSPQVYTADEHETERIRQYLGFSDFIDIRSIPDLAMGFYLVELAQYDALSAVKPDFSIAGKLANKGNIIVTVASPNDDVDMCSRVFAPGVGIPEDQVTGAAHCSLAPYWSKKLQKADLRAYQASKRGGYLYLNYDETKSNEGVRIRGEALTVIRGELIL